MPRPRPTPHHMLIGLDRLVGLHRQHNMLATCLVSCCIAKAVILSSHQCFDSVNMSRHVHKLPPSNIFQMDVCALCVRYYMTKVHSRLYPIESMIFWYKVQHSTVVPRQIDRQTDDRVYNE